MGFDPQAFLNDGSAATQLPGTSPTEDPAPAAAAPAAATPTPAPKGFDPKRFINDGQGTDPLTDTKIPLAFSGNTPETAMNRSPLSTSDRLAMSFGNVSGNIKHLQDKFAEVKPIMGEDGKPTKNLAVRDGNTWFAVDPKSGSTPDPWDVTRDWIKEAKSVQADIHEQYVQGAKKAAGLMPEGIGMGIALLADAATDGASLPATAAIAGASTAAVRTSLGRAIGTYDATPQEQAWDIGFETLLNASGAKVLAGVKPTAGWVADKLGTIKEAFKDTVEPMIPDIAKKVGGAVANSPKTAFKKIFASYSVGENNFDTMVENTDRVSGLMKQLYSKAGSDVGAYHDEALRGQLGDIQSIANDARTSLSNIYGAMRNKMLAQVSNDFSTNLQSPVYRTYADALRAGIGKIEIRSADIVKEGVQDLFTGATAPDTIIPGVSKFLYGSEAATYLARNGGKTVAFHLLDKAELQTAINNNAKLSEGIGDLASDTDAYNIMKDFYDRVGTFARGGSRTGVNGARALLDFKKIATNLSYDLANTDLARSKPAVKNLLDTARSSMDDQVFQELKNQGLGEAFTTLNATYNKLSDGFFPLLQAKKQFEKSGNPKVFEGLLNTFLSRPGKNATARFAIDEAIDAARSNGLNSLSQDMLDSKLQIQVAEAAKAFNPIKSGVLKADAIGMGQAMMTTYAIQNPLYAAGAVGMQLLRQPQTARLAVAGVQSLAKGQELLSKMSKIQVQAFLNDPKSINAFTTGIIQAPLVRAQAEQAMQAMLPQQGQQQ